MAYTTLVILIALLEYIYFMARVGIYRGKQHIQAPACQGDEIFERHFRVQQNTLEQLIIFIPSLYAFCYWVSPLWGVLLGCIFIVGRFIYATAYVRDPSTRGPGMLMSFIPTCLLLGGAVIGVLLNIVGILSLPESGMG